MASKKSIASVISTPMDLPMLLASYVWPQKTFTSVMDLPMLIPIPLP